MKKSKASSTSSLSYSLLAVAGVFALFVGYKYLSSPKQDAKKVGINEVAEVAQSPVFGLVVTPSTTPLDLNFKTPVKLVLNAGQTMQDGPTDVVKVGPDGQPQPFQAPVTVPNKLIAATIEFTYDPSQITITDLAKGDFFPNTLSAPVIDAANKKVTMSFGVVPGESGKTGSGVVATFNVQPKVEGQSTITFGSYAPTPTYEKCVPPPNMDPNLKIKWMCPQVAMYRYPGLITNTDIRAENIEGNMYAASFGGGMRKMYAQQAEAGPAAELSKKFVINEPSYTFVTTGRTASDIVDDADAKGDQVNSQDYAQFVLDFNKTGAAGWIRSDIVKDGKVNVGDFATLVKEWSL